MDSSDLTPEMILEGYREGWFPMMVDEITHETGWFKPKRRCLFPIEGMHVSKSLRKTIQEGKFEVRFDTAFEEVISNCRRPKDNWINDDFIKVYTDIHREGWAHCAECWINEKLVGGVYGVAIRGVFCAESMFHRNTDASKVALYALIETCRAKGFVLFDAQIMNPHLRSLGAFEVSDREYRRLFSEALQVQTDWST